MIVTDPEVPENLEDQFYLDPLWEALRLVKLLIRQVAGRGLDVGCGSGVFSLVTSSFCEQVIGVDISPRAIEFSRFNSALNGVRNVAFIESDLFDSVRSRQFDLIVFNSPTDEESYEYRDLLECGEQLLARFFTDLGDPLTPAGHGQINLAMNDYAGSRFSDRLQNWIKANKHDLGSRWFVSGAYGRMVESGNGGGPRFAVEVICGPRSIGPTQVLAAATSPREPAHLVPLLLENYELLNLGKQLSRLTWSEGLCCVPPGNQALGLWDAPLTEVPEDRMVSLGFEEPLSFPTGSRFDPLIEVCLRKGLLRKEITND